MGRALNFAVLVCLCLQVVLVSASGYGGLEVTMDLNTPSYCPSYWTPRHYISVSVSVKNKGTEAAQIVDLTVTFPSSLAIKAGSISSTACTGSDGLECQFDSIGAGDSIKVTFKITGASGAIASGKYQFHAEADADNYDAFGTKSTVNTQDCTSVKDDPHFVGAHGVTFDFNGIPDSSFCLITDPNIHINMLVNGYYGGDHAHTLENAHKAKDPKAIAAMKDGDAHAELYTWIRELMIFWHAAGKKHTLRLVARSGNQKERGSGFMKVVELDGQALTPLTEGGSFEDSESLVSMSLAYETAPQWDGTGHYDIDCYKLRIGDLLVAEVRLRVAHPTFQLTTDVETHINLKIANIKLSDDVHGVLGQTYREDRAERTALYKKIVADTHQRIKADKPSGKGFLDGETVDYKTSEISSTDCKFDRFTPVAEVSSEHPEVSSEHPEVSSEHPVLKETV